MSRPNFLQFKNLRKQKDLIHGIFDKSWGNIDFKFGEKEKVKSNRQKIAQALDIDLKTLYEMNQVHGSNVRVLEDKSIRVLGGNIVKETDGLITKEENIFLMIKTADCFPLLFFDPKNKVGASVHVGWRGAIEKIFFHALLKMVDQFGSKPGDILVGIGPGIQTCCFRHKTLIQEKLPEWKKYIIKKKDDFKALNLLRFIKDQLMEAGVKKQNIESMKICTACDQGFFSHFRSLQTGEAEGRFASIIAIRK